MAARLASLASALLALSLAVPAVASQAALNLLLRPGNSVPALTLPEHLRHVPASVAPPPRVPPIQLDDPGRLETFDPMSGVSTRPGGQRGTLPSLRGSSDQVEQPHIGALIQDHQNVIGTDDRTRVPSTTVYPWRTIVKILAGYPDGAILGCTGAIVGRSDGNSFHVLTAGHCIHSKDHGGWSVAVVVVPGLDDTFMPYNYAIGVTWTTYTAWIENADSRYDFAIIKLDRRIGNIVGWMGYQTAPSSDPIYTGVLNVAGYPVDKGSKTMWFDSDVGLSADDFQHRYFMDTEAGQSGAPIWRLDGVGPYILSVHTLQLLTNGVPTLAAGTRLNLDNFNTLKNLISGDPLPVDKPDLVDDGIIRLIDPHNVTPGVTTFGVTIGIRNVGTAPSPAGVCVSYYASTDTTITTADYLIGTTCSTPAINPFGAALAGWTGTSPASIPSGMYWVGWVIDSGNAVAEFDKVNNVSYNTGFQLAVGSVAPPEPTSIVASILPGSRSVQVGVPATAFATIINTGSNVAVGCSISIGTPISANFLFQTTNRNTNGATGTPNTPANIPVGDFQTFYFAITPTGSIATTDVQLRFDCTNTDPAPVIVGVNTLLLTASTGPAPDIVALAAVGPPNNGIVSIPGTNGTGVFAVASVNVGSGGLITVSADTGAGSPSLSATATLPIALTLCQTNPSTGVCVNPTIPASSVNVQINAFQTPTFAIFVKGNGVVSFSPAINRVFVRFKDGGGVTRGSTSVAVQTQ